MKIQQNITNRKAFVIVDMRDISTGLKVHRLIK